MNNDGLKGDIKMTKFADRIVPIPEGGVMSKIFAAFDYPDALSLGDGVPDASTFPVQELKAMTIEAFDEADDPVINNVLFSYLDGGYPKLKEFIFDRCMNKYNTGNPEMDSIQLFGGAQQLIDLVAKIYCNPGDTIIVEDSSYGGAIFSFEEYQANVVGVPIDEHGIIPEALEETLKREKNVKFIYVIPTFSNPTGIEMSPERRKAVYDLAVKYDVMIFEDSPYFELRYSGDYIPTIKSMDTTGHVIFAGSLSKIICPGIRIGYAIGPKPVMDAILNGKINNDISGPGIIQVAVAKYLEKYDLDAHIAECCDLYRTKRDAMLAALEREMGDIATWTHPEGGFFLWLTIPEGLSGKDFAVYVAEKKHVVLYPGANYHPKGEDVNAVRLNFSVPTEDQIDDCIKKVGDALKEFIELNK